MNELQEKDGKLIAQYCYVLSKVMKDKKSYLELFPDYTNIDEHSGKKNAISAVRCRGLGAKLVLSVYESSYRETDTLYAQLTHHKPFISHLRYLRHSDSVFIFSSKDDYESKEIKLAALDDEAFWFQKSTTDDDISLFTSEFFSTIKHLNIDKSFTMFYYTMIEFCKDNYETLEELRKELCCV